MNLYAIRDVKADTYSVLHPAPSDVIAQRSLTAGAMEPGSALATYPEDYQLYQLGEWEPNSGEIKGLRAPRFVCSVLELVRAARQRAMEQAQEKDQFQKRFAEAGGEVK